MSDLNAATLTRKNESDNNSSNVGSLELRPPVIGQEHMHHSWESSSSSKTQPTSVSSKRTFESERGQQRPTVMPNIPQVPSSSTIQTNTSHANSDRLMEPLSSKPAWQTWATSLNYLLLDEVGVELFKSFLVSEGKQHVDELEFWFAVEGLHSQTTAEMVTHLVKAIFKRYFIKTQLPLDEDMRRGIIDKYKQSSPHELADLFDDAQTYLEQKINRSTFPNFFKSDIFLQYVHAQTVQNDECVVTTARPTSPTTSTNPDASSISKPTLSLPATSAYLPTLHEDAELTSDVLNDEPYEFDSMGSEPQSLQMPRLTRDVLLQTQSKRALDMCPKPEAYARSSSSMKSYHALYCDYNPASRVPSNLQSSTDTLNTATDTSSIDGSSVNYSDNERRSYHYNKRSGKSRMRHIDGDAEPLTHAGRKALRDKAVINVDGLASHHVVIPRTARILPPHQLTCDEFALQLGQKLDKLRKEQELKETFEIFTQNSGLTRTAGVGETSSEACAPPATLVPAHDLTAAFCDKLQVDDESDQAILDQHVSRVWSETTPVQSPGGATPGNHFHHPPMPSSADYNLFNTVNRNTRGQVPSSVRGNMVNMGPRGSVLPIGQEPKMVKSKSMNEYARDDSQERFQRFVPNRSSFDKRSEAIDGSSEYNPSGTSSGGDKGSRVWSWLLDSDQRTLPGVPNVMTRQRKSTTGSGVSSTEITTSLSGVVGGAISRDPRRRLEPAQPFVADPNMPPLPLPNTNTQLEEVRRRLVEGDTSALLRSSMIAQHNAMSLQRRANANKQMKMMASGAAQPFTSVMLTFCDEEFPYLIKIPGTMITLRQFKDFLPKKGTYRYFFKTLSEEQNVTIQEEVVCDADVLPLWEGNIVARVKQLE